jgi:predicted HTH transcriptional regulator
LEQASLDACLEQLRLARPKAGFLRGPREATLFQLRIIREVDGVLRPTVAGLLAFGKYPQQFLPQFGTCQAV